jgi:hypothetical protein
VRSGVDRRGSARHRAPAGAALQILLTLPKNDNDIWVANRLAQFEDEHQADGVFIDAGYGTGIKSAGDAMGRSGASCWFGSAPSDPAPQQAVGDVGRHQGVAQERRRDPGRSPQLREDLIGPRRRRALDGKMRSSRRKT